MKQESTNSKNKIINFLKKEYFLIVNFIDIATLFVIISSLISLIDFYLQYLMQQNIGSHAALKYYSEIEIYVYLHIFIVILTFFFHSRQNWSRILLMAILLYLGIKGFYDAYTYRPQYIEANRFSSRMKDAINKEVHKNLYYMVAISTAYLLFAIKMNSVKVAHSFGGKKVKLNISYLFKIPVLPLLSVVIVLIAYMYYLG